ncbi:hypothetical protein B9Z55_018361 [Caenorhabditis nigoni]|uniref:G-protein coupled receptors family 1 profile domain-containing protein n=1 Tax=Caenorhabditis nigoni TaxID=1611254 RepID=A0A2G5TDS3_9PELO|nr:hypothetical protein B9Z55_018361 [Caenorhabditis nigoni]
MDSIICMVCLWGIACAIVTTSVNVKLITGLMSNKSKKNDEMRLFYCRFIIDMCFGISLFTSVLITLLSIRAPDLIQDYRSIIILHSLPWSNLAACRSIIALSITADRVLAAYFPISYRTGKFMMPVWLIISTSIAFALSEEIVLFGCCSYDFVVPANCKVFGCAVNKCFYSFWTIHKSVIFLTISVLSIFLSVRSLFYKSSKHTTANSQITKANRLALLDTVVVLIFDFIPSLCGSMSLTASFFNFEVIGPYIAVAKVTGCAIEAIIVAVFLIAKKPKQLKSITVNGKKVTVVNHSTKQTTSTFQK